jgi:hypothetical protein
MDGSVVLDNRVGKADSGTHSVTLVWMLMPMIFTESSVDCGSEASC